MTDPKGLGGENQESEDQKGVKTETVEPQLSEEEKREIEGEVSNLGITDRGVVVPQAPVVEYPPPPHSTTVNNPAPVDGPVDSQSVESPKVSSVADMANKRKRERKAREEAEKKRAEEAASSTTAKSTGSGDKGKQGVGGGSMASGSGSVGGVASKTGANVVVPGSNPQSSSSVVSPSSVSSAEDKPKEPSVEELRSKYDISERDKGIFNKYQEVWEMDIVALMDAEELDFGKTPEIAKEWMKSQTPERLAALLRTVSGFCVHGPYGVGTGEDRDKGIGPKRSHPLNEEFPGLTNTILKEIGKVMAQVYLHRGGIPRFAWYQRRNGGNLWPYDPEDDSGIGNPEFRGAIAEPTIGSRRKSR